MAGLVSGHSIGLFDTLRQLIHNPNLLVYLIWKKLANLPFTQTDIKDLTTSKTPEKKSRKKNNWFYFWCFKKLDVDWFSILVGSRRNKKKGSKKVTRPTIGWREEEGSQRQAQDWSNLPPQPHTAIHHLWFGHLGLNLEGILWLPRNTL